VRAVGAQSPAAPGAPPPGPPPIPPPSLSLAALPATAASVDANANTRPAGRLAGGVLTVALETRTGVWRPEGPDGPALPVFAFAEPGGAPTTPGPLLRVPTGTEVRATVHNTLPVPITVHGLGAARGAADSGTVVAPGARAAFRFRAGAPGVSYYAAYAGPRRPPMVRFHDDTQLHGAIVVDPPARAGAAPRGDRIFVISSWFTRDTTAVSGLGPNSVLAINGRSWPFTERLTVPQGDTARWRVVNASLLEHPMHLHGAHFRVDARGDAGRDTVYAADQRRLAVTELLLPGQTASLAWTPVHPGNWVFHCHLASHITVREAFEADRRMPPAASLVLARNPAGAPASAGRTAGTRRTGRAPSRTAPAPTARRGTWKGWSWGSRSRRASRRPWR
jgi:FtsP/CotA-like multicopper oxidase with cupredoxin domain